MAVTSSESDMSEEALLQGLDSEYRSKIWPVTVVFGLEVVFGFFGNLLVLYVFVFRYKPCNFRYFVLFLAVIDFSSCLTTIPGEMVSQLNWNDYSTPPVCYIKNFFNQFTVVSMAGCLTTIAIDRFRKVCRPHGWQITRKVGIVACVIILIVAAILAIPTVILWGIRSNAIVYKGHNITVTHCEKIESFKSSTLPFLYTAVNGCLVTVSMVCMFVLYVYVVKTLVHDQRMLRRRKTGRKEEASEPSGKETDTGMGSSDEKPDTSFNNDTTDTEGKTGIDGLEKSKNKPRRTKKIRRKTFVMFYLTVIYIVTIIVYYIILTFVSAGLLPKLTVNGRVVAIFFQRLYFVNHVINPVLYGLLDRYFLAEMRRLGANLLDVLSRCSKK